MPKYVRKNNRRPKKTNYPYKGDMFTRAMRHKMSLNEVAHNAWAGVKYLKSIVNVEHQKIDFTVNTAASTTPVVTHITAVAVGDAEGSRTGNSLLAKYLYLKSNCQLNTSANFDRVRIVVVRDKQQIADTAPAMTDVYESGTTQSLINKLTVGRFDILYDRLLVLDAQNPSYAWDKYIRLNSHVRYNGTASTDQQKGAIYVMYVGTQATNTAAFAFNARLMYVDN